MNTMINESPVESGTGGRPGKRARSTQNARADRHCLGDPAEWGWCRPAIDDLVAERIEDLERMFDELG